MREFWNLHHQFGCFVLAVFVCFAVNFLALKCTSDSYLKGQRTIVETYEEGIVKLDSIRKLQENDLERILKEREKTISRILSDTIIDSAQGLCAKQKDAVRKYVKPYLEVTTRELDLKERINSNPNSEFLMLKEEIKSLLQLEFNKMQNEYEALELWAAILTVVFLIFSFYSFFKTERLEEQGRQSITRINSLEGEARVNLENLQESIRNDHQNLASRTSEAFDDLYNRQSNRMRTLENETVRMLQDYQNRIEELIREVRDQNENHIDEVNDTIVIDDDHIEGDNNPTEET